MKTFLAAAALLLSAANAVQLPNGDYLISYHQRCCAYSEYPRFLKMESFGHVISDWTELLDDHDAWNSSCSDSYGGGGRVVKKKHDEWPSVEEGKDWAFQETLMAVDREDLLVGEAFCVSVKMMVPGFEPFASEANFFTPDFLDELTRRRPTVKIEMGRGKFDPARIAHLESVTASRVYDYEEVYGMDKTLASEEDVRAVVSAPSWHPPKRLKAYFENLRVAEEANRILFKYQLQGCLTWEMVEKVKNPLTTTSSATEGRKRKSRSQESIEAGRRSKKSKRSKMGKKSKTQRTNIIRPQSKSSNINKDLALMPLFSSSNSELRKRFLSTAMRDKFPGSSISAEDPQRITDYLLVNSFLPAHGFDYSRVLEEANVRNAKHPMLSVCGEFVNESNRFKNPDDRLMIDAKQAVAEYSRRSFRDVEPGDEEYECFALALINVEDDSIPCANVKVDVMTAMIRGRLHWRFGHEGPEGSTITQFGPISRDVELSRIGRGSSTDTIASVMGKVANAVEAGKFRAEEGFKRTAAKSRKWSAVKT